MIEERIENTASKNNSITTNDETLNENIKIETETVPVINYALQQNRLSIIQCITIHNATENDIENANIKIHSDNEALIPFEMAVNFIPAKKSMQFKNPDIKLNAEFLAGITEKISGYITVTLSKGEEVIAEENIDVTILAFDEWHGYGYYPELLSAFVTPNHPSLVKILARAAELLKEWTSTPSMNAYQTQDPNRVLMQAAAIFSALKEENIVYSVPPASFETAGQRVRLCDAVLQQKFGTCLDLTLLYASCLEAIGLHPLLILKEGHIFSGVWLDDLSFPEAVQSDASIITKRLASGVNEIAVVETTLCVNGKNASFDDARIVAERELVGTEPIEYIIDVRRARMGGITPLPQRIQTDNGWYIEHEEINDNNTHIEPKAIDGIIKIDPQYNEQNNSKLVQWERKLLDLGLRNNLINLRFSKTLIPILTSSLDDLEDALSGGNDFSILPKPSDLPTSSSELNFENTHDIGPFIDVIKTEFENKRLRTVYTEGELTYTIKGLYRTSKTALEENGANTLYLALGLLRWYENEHSAKPRYAPLVLLPVEIIRKSAQRGYVIRVRDDEPQMNITVLEKIKQDFGINVNGVDPLPTDDSGVDLRMVFTILRKAIMDQPRWDILESAYLGIFSFSQFVMWNDLRNRSDDLIKNKVVKSLVDGKLAWEAQPMEIGEHVNEDDVLLPMSADASQLYAIKSACNGESFVLHGPPGTGKSQTITSLIANALAQGKSVLFVAEKMAALSVVQKRLENIGIGPFCLELHSNKSKKRDVLEQLRRAAEVTKYRSAEQYATKAEQIAKLRHELDAYASQLHAIMPAGYSLYELINEYEEYKNAPEIAAFSKDYAQKIKKTDIDEHIILLERLIATAKSVEHPANHPLSPITLTTYSQQLRSELNEKVSAYKNSLSSISDTINEFSSAINNFYPHSYQDIEKAFSVAKELKIWLTLPKSWAKEENLYNYLNSVKEMAQHYIKANSLRKNLMQNWNEMFLEQNSAQLWAEYKSVSEKWFLPKSLGISKLCKKLSLYSLQKLQKEKIGDAIAVLYNYQKELKLADELFSKCGNSLENLYSGQNTNWADIVTFANTATQSATTLNSITGNESLRTTYCGEVSLQKIIEDLLDKFPALTQNKNACYTLLGVQEATSDDDWINDQITICENILSNADIVKEWISFNAIASEICDQGLENVVDAYKKGMAHEDIINAYKKAISYTLCNIIIDNNDALNSFSGAVFNEKIQQFKRIDNELIALSQKEIYCRLASKIPNFVADAAHSSELGILQRMIKSGGRGTSIRKLFDDIANLLPRLCPCMLMSPISAAQYLDPKREAFDIVVFDEASQLPTCKAVGVLARGKDAVIVGDPKQMPPTSFFATNTVDEDNLDVEDLESILDDCLALNMPQTHLLWHYRSRHESLIAFSNNQFYENKLFTFPSVNDRESKVSLVHIDGVFDRGKTRRNQGEASAIIEEIKRRCHDPILSKQSIGVVTFNISQQHLIDDMLSAACLNDSELEKWVYESEEPIFIKNLENVQGDERDVILFSIGYGPDENGKVYMNFGPLNREGGWRRLNVAVSRARCEMIVFSTLTHDQINLSSTNSEGVAALKSFLAYAAGNELALTENSVKQYHNCKEGIIKTICDYLNTKGFNCDISVGHSEYRIDIGVIDPANPEKYILGILLDGSCYGSSKTTRDREIAQISVLNSLGWNIMRVWTMDWWDNSQKELERIFAKIEELQNGVEENIINCENEEDNDLTITEEIQIEATPNAEDSNLIKYMITTLENGMVSADDFVSGKYEKLIIRSINKVMQIEAPISRGLLTRRVVQSFGIARAGSRIQEYIDNIFSRLSLKYTQYNDEIFFWNNDQSPEQYTLIRTNDDISGKRDTIDVPTIEAENAVCYILEHQISLTEEDLIRESAKLMGYTRMGNIVSVLFLDAITSATNKGKIKKDRNDKYILAN